MQYNASALGNLLMSESRNKDLLMPSGDLTKNYKEFCKDVGTAISDVHNKWQASATIVGVNVFGGTCGVGGPLSSGKGLASPGSVVGVMKGSVGAMKGKFPNKWFPKRTSALTTYLKSIGDSYEELFNAFLSSSVIQNIVVSSGTCTCQIIMGAPIPGTYFGGKGILGSLSGNMKGSAMTASAFKSKIISNMGDECIVQGAPTKWLRASIEAVSSAFALYHEKWLQSTKIDSLVANGGVSIPNGPLVGSVANGGKFI